MTVSSQIIEVLNDLCMKFGLAIDWSQENVLPYLEELAGKYITWEIATSVTWIVIGVLCVIAGVFCMKFDLKKLHDGFLLGVGALLVLIAVFIIGTQVFDILECVYLPEKALFEYVSFLARQIR